jgi:Pyridoxamine 5'-phosphate oxidase
MAKFFEELSASHRRFIERQRIFFIGSAPATGRVNISPKGLDCLRILGSRRLAYLDLTGSGNETAAHTAENGRVTLMVCSFDAEPLILRAYGRGRAVHPRDADWAQLRPLFGPPVAGERQIIDVQVESVQTSCGFAVPFFDFRGDRDVLVNWAEKKGPQGVQTYWAEKNIRSIDGLPTGLLET